VKRVLTHYEEQTDDEAVAEEGAAFEVHLHAYPDSEFSSDVPNPVTGQPPNLRTAEAHLKATVAEMKRLNVVRAGGFEPLTVLQPLRTTVAGRFEPPAPAYNAALDSRT
jgi:hypothetical protein